MTDDHRVHQATWALLPWLANGRASAAERLRAEAHLRECASCRAELAHERQLVEGLAQPAARLPDVDVGLRRLMQRLDQSEVASTPPGRWGWFAGVRPGLGAVAALGLAELVLLGAMAAWWVMGGMAAPSPEQAPYRTLTQPQAALPAAPHWRVVFQDGMKLDELQRLLHEHRLTIAAGPSDAGVFTLAAEAPHALALADALAAQLRASPWVRFAEFVPDRGRP